LGMGIIFIILIILILAGAFVSRRSRFLSRGKESGLSLAAIVESSSDAIIGVTPEGIIDHWNAGAEQIYGYLVREAIGQPVSLIVPPERSDEAKDILEKILHGELVRNYETVHKRKNGSVFHVSLAVSPVRNDRGDIVGVSGIGRDITQRKRLEWAKDQFLGTVSHELRTPVATLKAAIDNLRDGCVGPLSEQQQKGVEIAARAADRLSKIVVKVLELSQLESGKAHLMRGQINCVSLLEDIVRGLKDNKEKVIALNIDPRKIFPSILADEEMVRQVVSNLIENALRYAKGKVGVTLYAENGSVQVTVEDDGPGISSENFERLFHRFEQVNRPIGGGGYKGTGLGLAICKEIIELHGGKIWVDSVPNQGSRFHFTLPSKT